MNSNPKNISMILKEVIKVDIILMIIISIILTIFFKPIWILSLILGNFFGFLNLNNLIKTGQSVLNKKNKNLFFPQFGLRLILYAVPVALAINFQHYFNFWIILISLFSFQIIYLVIELKINFKKYKNKSKKWTN